NLGMVPAINIGLARSDSDFAVILQPHSQVTEGWLAGLLAAAQTPHAGIASPLFRGRGAPDLLPITPGCSLMETFGVSFSALALKGEMHILLGGFDEVLDSGEWCLKDFVRRAWSRGYHCCVTSRSVVICGNEAVFGSDERRQQQSRISMASYRERWGTGRHYGIYFGRHAAAATLSDT